jgi:crotonobetainyl-CoA:carnitine CoA-transferase CaiB-like acyl-CoA transferase
MTNGAPSDGRQGALARLRVLDLSGFVSGPYATKLLADYGADVVKVEPLDGDPARRTGPFPEDIPNIEASGLFLHLNTNKRSVTLDLETEEGRALLLDLIPRFDIVVENFSPGYLDEIGLDDATMVTANPRLVIAHITPFGQTGPYRRYRETDLTLQAISGMVHHNGDPDREPLKLFGYQSYYLGGAHASVAILAALRRRDATGESQQVDLSIASCAGNVIVPPMTSWAYAGIITMRRGHGRGQWAIYPCADGFATVSVYHTGREWGDFARMVGSDAIKDPKFETAAGRTEHVEELESEILAWTIGRTKHELQELGRENRIAIGYTATVQDLIESPQLRSRDFFTQVEHPAAGTQTYPGAPVRLTGSPWRIRRRPPLLGEHNEEIYVGELGRRPEQLIEMSSSGVV